MSCPAMNEVKIAGAIMSDEAKITGITPDEFIFIGKNDDLAFSAAFDVLEEEWLTGSFFRENGTYITGLRPGTETEKYIRKVLNRVTLLGACSLALIACLPISLSLAGIVPASLALGGTGLIIVVGVALEVFNQIEGLLAGKDYAKVI